MFKFEMMKKTNAENGDAPSRKLELVLRISRLLHLSLFAFGGEEHKFRWGLWFAMGGCLNATSILLHLNLSGERNGLIGNFKPTFRVIKYS